MRDPVRRRRRRPQRADHRHRAPARPDPRLEARFRGHQRRERSRRVRHHRGDLQRVASMPAPTPSRSAIMPGTRRRRWSSSSARPGWCGRSTIPPARRAAARRWSRPRTARGSSSSTPWAASSWTRSTIRSPPSSAKSLPVRCSAGADAIIVDMHAEATSEKQAMGYFCDGRASLVVGTHTHCADRGPCASFPAAPPSCPTSA